MGKIAEEDFKEMTLLLQEKDPNLKLLFKNLKEELENYGLK